MLGLGEALGRVIAFAATVYVARRLGADVYGVIAVAGAIVLYCSHLADFSIEVIGAREVAQDPASAERIAGPLVAARLRIAAALVVVLSLVGLLLLPQPDGAILAATSLTLLTVAGSTRFVFVGLERPAAVAAVRVLGELAAFLLVLLLARDAGDIGNVPLSRFAGEGLGVVTLAVLLRRRGIAPVPHGERALVRPIFTRAAPLVAHAILGLVIFNSDLVFLRVIRDARTAGIYAAAYTLVSFLLNIGVTYGNSLLPVLSRLAIDPPRQRALYDDAMMQALAVALPVAAGGWFLAGGLLDAVFGATYVSAVPALQILIWSVIAAIVRNVVQMRLIAHHHQSFVMKTSAWSAAANLILNAILIPRFGMPGAAVATLATEAVRTVIALVYAERLGLQLGIARRIWRPALATAVMMLALRLLAIGPAPLAVVAGAAVYGVVLAILGGITMTGGRPALSV